MIVLYGGRVTIFRYTLSENWRVKLKLPVNDLREYDLGTPDVRQAYIRAQYHYMAWKHKISFEEEVIQHQGKRKCWDCDQWSARWNECSLGFPEARQTGGRFATRCGLYSNGTERAQTDGTNHHGC